MTERSVVRQIVIETGLGKGIEEYGNMGDVSMLQAAVGKLQQCFPGATLRVLTDSPENLARYCPGATPLLNSGRALWFAEGVMLGPLSRVVPRRVIGLLVRGKRALRARRPRLVEALLARRLLRRNRRDEAQALFAFRRAMEQADLVLVSGSGGFFDGCQGWNLEILDLVEAAVQQHTPVAMIGQGFGPLADPLVLRRAAAVLPRVDLLSLRGGHGSLAAVQALGVPDAALLVTGDEAVEMAYEARPDSAGSGLGINLRYAASATTDEHDVAAIRPVLHAFVRRQAAPLVPLPIAMQVYTRDDEAIRMLLAGLDDASTGGAGLDTPLKVIEQAGRCRVIVTGAYHAAVFALAQGVSVVALARSSYFAGKFLGLQQQFGAGCQTVLLGEPQLPQRLTQALDRAWDHAEIQRGPLLATARRQIEQRRLCYERLVALVEGRVQARAVAR